MAIYIEDAVPVVKHNGLNTTKAVSFGSTLAVTGASTLTGGVTGAISGTGLVTSKSATAPAAGGTEFFQMGNVANLGIYAGSGAPSAAAGRGSIYVRTDAAATNTRLYINTDGDTTWATFTASA